MLRRLLWALLVVFVLLNGVVALHAWRFTHFTTDAAPRTRNPEKLSTNEKIELILTGLKNPKPVNLAPPSFPYENVTLHSPNGRLAGWPAGSARC